MVYRIWNRGTKRAKVMGIRTTCGCASPIVSARSIKPGESIDVTVSVEPIQGADREFTVWLSFRSPHDRDLPLKGKVLMKADPVAKTKDMD